MMKSEFEEEKLRFISKQIDSFIVLWILKTIFMEVFVIAKVEPSDGSLSILATTGEFKTYGEAQNAIPKIPGLYQVQKWFRVEED